MWERPLRSGHGRNQPYSCRMTPCTFLSAAVDLVRSASWRALKQDSTHVDYLTLIEPIRATLLRCASRRPSVHANVQTGLTHRVQVTALSARCQAMLVL